MSQTENTSLKDSSKMPRFLFLQADHIKAWISSIGSLLSVVWGSLLGDEIERGLRDQAAEFGHLSNLAHKFQMNGQ